MTEQIQLGEISVDVQRKEIKNIHLSVHPPTGRVTISAPNHYKTDVIRVFAVSKLAWIKNHQKKILSQDRENAREYLERESHYLWGKRYLLSIEYVEAPPKVALTHQKIILQVRPDTPASKRQDVLEDWYRETLKTEMPDLISKWEKRMNVQVARFYVQRMKTKWGSCTPARKSIRLNTELVKKPKPCLEYLVVHEMAHLIESTHNERFIDLMDHFMPQWQFIRDVLNDLPVRHEHWRY